MTSKTCIKCNESKTIDQFSKQKGSPDGHQYACKTCAKASAAVYNADNRELVNAKNAAYSRTPKGKFAKYKAGAKTRNISFNLTIDEFLVYWGADCSYCGDQIATVGIDRVDSSLGYTVDNVVPCCRMCNIIKLDHDNDILNTHMLKMLKHQGVM